MRATATIANPAIQPFLTPKNAIEREIVFTGYFADELGASLCLVGHAEDQRRPGAAHAPPLATARVSMDLSEGPARAVKSIAVMPSSPVETLVGRSATSGFRRALGQVDVPLSADGRLLARLLTEVPNVAMLSRVLLRQAGVDPSTPGVSRVPPLNVCAGFAAGTPMGTMIEQGREPDLPAEVPMPRALRARLSPVVQVEPDRRFVRWRKLAAWRNTADGGYVVRSWFRDTTHQSNGKDLVLHEYDVTATLDDTHTVTSCMATPRVLPSVACGAAAHSARALVGTLVERGAGMLRSSLTGTRSCTHLTDHLVAVDDFRVLVQLLDRGEPLP